MAGDNDLVRNFLRQLVELYPQTPARDVQRLEVELRAAWGGRRVYVKKSDPPTRPAKRSKARRRPGTL